MCVLGGGRLRCAARMTLGVLACCVWDTVWVSCALCHCVYVSSVVCLCTVLCEVEEELVPCILVSGPAAVSAVCLLPTWRCCPASGGVRQGQEATGPPLVEGPCACVAGSEGMYATAPPAPLPRVVNGQEFRFPGYVHVCEVGRDNGTLLAEGEILCMEPS